MSNLSIHDLTPKEVNIPNGLKRILGLSLGFVPTPQISREQGNQMWRTAILDLERKVKLGLFFGCKRDPHFIQKLHVKNKLWNPPIILPAHINNWFEKATRTTYPIKHRLQFNLSKQQRKLLRELSARQDIIVVDAD